MLLMRMGKKTVSAATNTRDQYHDCTQMVSSGAMAITGMACEAMR